MTDPHHDDRLQRLVRRIVPHGTVRRAWRLTGGVSAEVTAIEVEHPDGPPTRLVVRRHGDVDRERNPRIARDEFTLLRLARAHGLAAPQPYHLDESRDFFPTSVLITAYVEGHPEFAPSDLAAYVAQAAAQLARVHRVPDAPDLSFLPRLGRGFSERPVQLDASLDEGRIRDALEAAWPLSGPNDPVLLHGDFWPGNLLWRDGALVAVLDWEDAHVGDPLADLANARLEFLWAFGRDAMHELTDRYRAATTVDFANLPYWDLCAALRPCSKLSGWGLDAPTERRMRDRHAAFVAQALASLPLR